MKRLYNQAIDKIENIEMVFFQGVNKFPEDMSEDELNTAGFYNISYIGSFDNQFEEKTEAKELIGNIYTISTSGTPKNIDSIKTNLLAKIKQKFIQLIEKPRVSATLPRATSLVVNVDGGRSDKDNFKEKWEDMLTDETTTIKDADNNFIPNITKDEMYLIYKAIFKNGELLYGWKWSKEMEVNACQTIDELKAVVI